MSIALVASNIARATETLELNGNNVVILNEEMNDTSTHKFLESLVGARLSRSVDEPIYIVIASNGGSYRSARILEQAMPKVLNIRLICKYCASAAGLIFATSPVRRYVTKESVFMMHEMAIMKVTVARLTPTLISDFKKNSDSFNKDLYTLLGISKEEYEKKITDKEWNLVGSDIVKNHLADAVVSIHCDSYMNDVAPWLCNPLPLITAPTK